MKRGKTGSTDWVMFEGQQEWVRFLDKILVFYTSDQANRLCCMIIPKEEIYRVDPESYLFYVDWNASFDTCSSFLGKKIRASIISIFENAIKCTAIAVMKYRLLAFENQRKAAMKAIRRKIFKLMKRYYKGNFMTARFRNAVICLIQTVGSKLTISLQADVDYPQQILVEYVN